MLETKYKEYFSKIIRQKTFKLDIKILDWFRRHDTINYFIVT